MFPLMERKVESRGLPLSSKPRLKHDIDINYLVQYANTKINFKKHKGQHQAQAL